MKTYGFFDGLIFQQNSMEIKKKLTLWTLF